MTAPYPPPATPANDRTTLWGVLGIIGAFCCWPLGLVFAIMCLLEARRVGRPPTLAYVTFIILGIGLVLDIIFSLAYLR